MTAHLLLAAVKEIEDGSLHLGFELLGSRWASPGGDAKHGRHGHMQSQQVFPSLRVCQLRIANRFDVAKVNKRANLAKQANLEREIPYRLH